LRRTDSGAVVYIKSAEKDQYFCSEKFNFLILTNKLFFNSIRIIFFFSQNI